MKTRTALTFVVATSFIPVSAGAAGGLLQSLPKDGSWVKYGYTAKSEEGGTVNLSGTATLSSVGEVSENGVKYRWIEVYFEGSQNDRLRNVIWKFLVAEKDIGPKTKGTPQVVRGYLKINDADSIELSDFWISQKGPASVLFGGDPDTTKEVKKETVIDFHDGQLKIATAFEDSFEYNANAMENADPIKSAVQRTVWKHENVPFGTAKMVANTKLLNVRAAGPKKMTMEFELLEFGKDAKTRLPDQN